MTGQKSEDVFVNYTPDIPLTFNILFFPSLVMQANQQAKGQNSLNTESANSLYY